MPNDVMRKGNIIRVKLVTGAKCVYESWDDYAEVINISRIGTLQSQISPPWKFD